MMRRRRAFTLIEITAATALAAMTMMVLLSVASSLPRSSQQLRAHAEAGQRHAPLLDLLRRDLAQARRIDTAPNRLTLIGYGSLDRATLAPTHHPVRVTYALLDVGGQRALVREQVSPGDLTNHDGYVELVQLGVDTFELRPLHDSPPPTSGTTSSTGPVWEPLPPAAALTLRWSQEHGESSQSLHEVILLH